MHEARYPRLLLTGAMARGVCALESSSLHLVVCANQCHHILRLARQWKSLFAMFALLGALSRPQQETEAQLGDGWVIHSGPSFTRLQYMHIRQVELLVFFSNNTVEPLSYGHHRTTLKCPQYGDILHMESAPNNVMTLSSRHMPPVLSLMPLSSYRSSIKNV